MTSGYKVTQTWVPLPISWDILLGKPETQESACPVGMLVGWFHLKMGLKEEPMRTNLKNLLA